MTEVSETRTLKLPRHYNQICSMWLSLPRLDKMSTSGRAKPDPPPPFLPTLYAARRSFALQTRTSTPLDLRTWSP